VIIYDVTSVDSFSNMDKWIEDVKKERGPDAVLIMVGNKIDLDRKVSREAAELKAREFNLIYFEVSAKTGDYIKNLFLGLS
jgi:Ras-related protein Rab-6A